MRRPFHPVLYAAFPVLFLFRENLWGLRSGEVVLPVAGTVAAVGLVQIAASLITHRPRKVAIVVSTLAVLFLTYGHAWRLVSGDRRQRLGIDTEILVGAIWIAVAALVVIGVVRTKRKLVDATRVLNIFAIAMFATIALPLALTFATGAAVEAETVTAPRIPVGKAPEVKRDIYYLVFDRYAGARSLKELFGYENREFLDRLEAKGFEVADASRANYQATVPSLASSMNLTYNDWLAQAVEGPDRESAVPFYDAIGYPELGRFLQFHGYRYIHIGSRWDMTRDSPTANVNIRLDEVSEFTRVFLGSTALLPAMRHGVFLPAATDTPEMSRKITLRQLDEVTRSTRFVGPKFVFSHFGLPHPPYVFDRHGNPRDDKARTVPAKARAYFEQLLYTNDRITEIVEHLLDVPAGQEPIIILQADEGPYPSFGWRTPQRWWSTTDRKLRTKFDILMATHMPGVESSGAYESMSPVNVFRVVLNAYFDTDLPILQDRSFVPVERGVHYEWVEITDRLRDPAKVSDKVLYPPRLPALPPIRREG